MKQKAIFLDRDGVINETYIEKGKTYPPQSLDQYKFLPGVHEGVAALKAQKFLILVVTNQPDIRTGKQKLEVTESMHRLISQELKVDEIYACYHIGSDHCLCRKPKPGMLLEAAKKWNIDFTKSYLVGDRWSDIAAGQAAGCKTFIIGEGYSDQKIATPDWAVQSLLEASKIILSTHAEQSYPG